MTGKGMMANLRKAGMTSSCTIWVGPPPTRPRRTMRSACRRDRIHQRRIGPQSTCTKSERG
jgi:hypothetical protein